MAGNQGEYLASPRDDSNVKEAVFEDPIVKEAHETRERLLAEHGGMDGLLREITRDRRRDESSRRSPQPTSADADDTETVIAIRN